jgi:hypothetical protein
MTFPGIPAFPSIVGKVQAWLASPRTIGARVTDANISHDHPLPM